MGKLTIDEVIGHCERTVERFEKQTSRATLEKRPLEEIFIKEYWEHRQVAEWLEELQAFKDKQEQGLLIELPCKVGDTVYVYNYCDYVCTSREWETGIEECPFENECEFEECKEGNERLFKTSIDSIWNNGQGWQFSVRGLHLEISINAIGKNVFLTEAEAEEALARMKGE